MGSVSPKSLPPAANTAGRKSPLGECSGFAFAARWSIARIRDAAIRPITPDCLNLEEPFVYRRAAFSGVASIAAKGTNIFQVCYFPFLIERKRT
jgi:hypothetical protein